MDDSSSVPTAKTVQCPRCKRFFASTGFLNRHIRVAHGDRFNGKLAPSEVLSNGSASALPWRSRTSVSLACWVSRSRRASATRSLSLTKRPPKKWRRHLRGRRNHLVRARVSTPARLHRGRGGLVGDVGSQVGEPCAKGGTRTSLWVKP